MNKRLTMLGYAASALIVIAIGCSKRSEDSFTTTPPPTSECDTVNMKYTADVVPILSANCYSCHGNGNASAGVTLDSYAGVKFVAESGDLIGTITHASGYPAMPQGGAKLSDCDINKIKSWIANGTQNN